MKPHGFKAEMRLVADGNQAGSLFHRVAEPKVIGKDSQLFAACFVVFHNLKP